MLIRNQDAVYVGADSRILNQFGEALGTECKITRIGDYYFAHAGLGLDAMYGFDLKALAQIAFSSSNEFRQNIKQFIRLVDTEGSAYLARIRNKRPELYARITRGEINIETAIIGHDSSGAPFFKVIKFAANESGNTTKITTPIVYECPGDCRGGKVIALMGQMQHAEPMVERWPAGMLRNPVRAINAMIGREIENNTKVGPPIAILKLTAQNSTWIQHDESCDKNHISKRGADF